MFVGAGTILFVRKRHLGYKRRTIMDNNMDDNNQKIILKSLLAT